MLPAIQMLRNQLMAFPNMILKTMISIAKADNNILLIFIG